MKLWDNAASPYAFKVRATGKTDDSPWVFIWKLRDGKVVSYEQFHDPAFAAAFA